MCVCMYVCMYVRTYVCVCVCMHVCLYVCTYVCMCVYFCYSRYIVNGHIFSNDIFVLPLCTPEGGLESDKVRIRISRNNV